MNKMRFYLTAVIAKDIYDKPLLDKSGNFIISHWVYGRQRFYPGNATEGGFEFLEDTSGGRYIPSGDPEVKVYSMKKGNVVYELVIP